MTRTINPEVGMTLTEAVGEVLVILTGQDLEYDPQYDRFRVITRHLNRALRENAMENEWAYYTDTLRMGPVQKGVTTYEITTDYRFRIRGDDAVRLLRDEMPVAWAYFLPRDALHKYAHRDGLWCATVRNKLIFSKPLDPGDDELTIELPVQREPRMFRLPDAPYEEDPDALKQLVDFDAPDVITARAAWLYAQTDPIMQPRVQTLEASYKDLMYPAIERDMAFTETPYQNEFIVPVQGSIYPDSTHRPWPVSNRR